MPTYNPRTKKWMEYPDKDDTPEEHKKWYPEQYDAGDCSDCGDHIEMTDVEGHYSGRCAKCANKRYVARTTPEEREYDKAEVEAERAAGGGTYW